MLHLTGVHYQAVIFHQDATRPMLTRQRLQTRLPDFFPAAMDQDEIVDETDATPIDLAD